jgi:hypothetical protein
MATPGIGNNPRPVIPAIRDTNRGHAKVSLEWILVCASYNLKRLFTLKNLAAAA